MTNWGYDMEAKTWTPPAGTGPHFHFEDQSRLSALEARATLLETRATTDESRITVLENHRSGEVVTVVSYQAVAGSAFYAGGSGFQDYPGPHDITIVKKYDAATSKLVVFGTVGVFKGTNSGAALIGLKFGATDHTIGTFFFNTLTEHGLVHCQDDTFSGLAAGTLIGRVRWDTPITSVNADANDAVRLTLLEVMI